MHRPALFAALVLATAPVSRPNLTDAALTPPRDELSECLIRSTTASDRGLLVRWMFALFSLHPEVKSVADIPAARRDELNRGMAALMERLLTEACVTEARATLAAGGSKSLETAFSALGSVAADGLFADPQVAAGMSEFTKYLDGDKLGAALIGGEANPLQLEQQ